MKYLILKKLQEIIDANPVYTSLGGVYRHKLESYPEIISQELNELIAGGFIVQNGDRVIITPSGVLEMERLKPIPPPPPPENPDVVLLRLLKEKGWNNLTIAEKADLIRIFFNVIRV